MLAVLRGATVKSHSSIFIHTLFGRHCLFTSCFRKSVPSTSFPRTSHRSIWHSDRVNRQRKLHSLNAALDSKTNPTLTPDILIKLLYNYVFHTQSRLNYGFKQMQRKCFDHSFMCISPLLCPHRNHGNTTTQLRLGTNMLNILYLFDWGTVSWEAKDKW